MKRLLILFLFLILTQNIGLCTDEQYNTSNLTIYSENNKFGLKNSKDEVVVTAKYKKLIRLGNTSWIIQKKNKFGLIDCCGNYLVEPRYSHVERKQGL